MKIKKYTYIMLAVLLFLVRLAVTFWIKNMMQPFQMKRCLLIRL